MENVGNVTKVLTEMSYLRFCIEKKKRFCIDLNVTRQLSGTKIEFMEPIRPLGKKAWYVAYRVSKSLAM